MARKPKQTGMSKPPRPPARSGSRSKPGPAIRVPAVVVVTKGGDGGLAVPEAQLHRASFAHERDNQRQVLTGHDIGRGLSRRARAAARVGFEDGLTETDDPFDCAHNDRDPANSVFYLAQGSRGVPRCGLADRPRRRYHASQLVGTGPSVVGVDSAFDALADRVRRLEAAGVSAGRVGAIDTSLLAEMLDARLPRGVRLRDVLHRRTTQDMTAEEREAQRAGSELLGVEDDS